MKLLGLDIGSSTIKGGVLDTEHRAVSAIVREPFPPPVEALPLGWFEVEPRAIVAGVESVTRSLIEAEPAARGILVSGQMGGLILVDRAGQALSNYLSWRDQRTLGLRPAGVSYLSEVRRRWTDRQFAELGSELKPGSAAALAFWLAENGLLPRGATLVSIADFAIARLCGTAPRTHATLALGLLHLPSGGWHRKALTALGLGDLEWPELAELNEPIGHVAANGRRYPCYAALGDQQCALRGAVLAPGELSLNISTGSQVSRLTPQLELGDGYQTRPYFDGAYLNTITHLPAGRSLSVLVDLLTELARAEGVQLAHVWKHIAQAAESADGGGLTCDLSFFAGPLGERGAISQITTENLTVGNLFRAACQNMVDNYALCAERLWPDRSWKQVNLSGGLAQSLPILRKLLQERFAVPIRESTETEETLLGLVDVARSLPQFQETKP